MLRILFWLFILFCIGLLCVFAVFVYYGQDLPDHKTLANHKPKTITRLYTADGTLLEEYFTERRIYVPYPAIPKRIVHAFIAAEDKNFFNHSGVDPEGILRATALNLGIIGDGKGMFGGSTITQQVVKNFLLTNERTIERKIKEAILAYRVTNEFTKEDILQIYLNEIYLGARNYGVATAALYYFDKSLDELSIAEAALLGALPKAPSKIDPMKYPAKAKARRDWVIRRMQEDGYITAKQAAQAKKVPIEVRDTNKTDKFASRHFAEQVRRFINDKFGYDELYGGGLTVRTTLDPKTQRIAENALEQGILAYDKRHGYRGGFAILPSLNNWQQQLADTTKPDAIGNWQIAAVLGVTKTQAVIGLEDGSKQPINLADNSWVATPDQAVKYYKKYRNKPGRHPKQGDLTKVLNDGDVILVENIGGKYQIRQIPAVNGAVIVMNPQNGKVIAMVGGYPHNLKDEFNRAVQAKRQPGSTFKPFVYFTAVEKGFKPYTQVIDGPIEVLQTHRKQFWVPQNSSKNYMGRISMRKALEQSRNTVAIRLGFMLGIESIAEVAQRFGVLKNPPMLQSISIGSLETTLLKMASAYSVLANGGKQVEPKFVERVQDRQGKTIHSNQSYTCLRCDSDDKYIKPVLEDTRGQIADPANIYIVTDMMKGVVTRGTAKDAGKVLKFPVVGKTGTTNDSKDAWFIGYTPDLVVGTYIGFDKPTSLGPREFGGTVALPVFTDVMKNYYKDKYKRDFETPSNIRYVKIDKTTGELPNIDTPDENIGLEIFNIDAPQEVILSDDYDESLEEYGLDSDSVLFDYGVDEQGNEIKVNNPYSGSSGIY